MVCEFVVKGDEMVVSMDCMYDDIGVRSVDSKLVVFNIIQYGYYIVRSM